jgi:lipoprotein NlpD
MHRYLSRLCIAIPGGTLVVLAACSTQVPLNPTSPFSPARISTASPGRVEQAVVVPSPTALHPPKADFAMPARGPARAWFDGAGNPGIDIAGQPGDPVFASRNGRVVLVSSALPAYETMIVIKHDDTFITAYAHLGKTLVRENDEVRQGQQIAEFGFRKNDEVALHFEIRKMGVAVDPELYLQGLAR